MTDSARELRQHDSLPAHELGLMLRNGGWECKHCGPACGHVDAVVDALDRMVAAMRPVLEAAEAWRSSLTKECKTVGPPGHADLVNAIIGAVDAYREATR